MTGLYLFAAAIGVPLALWFVLSGGDEGADGGEGGGDDGIGGLMFRLLPVSSLAIAAAAFGLTGLLLGATGTGAGATFALAAVTAVVAAVLNSAAFAYLRRSSSSTDVDDRDLRGAMGRVVLPVAGDRRGRIAISFGDQQRYLSADIVPGEADVLEVGAPVLVVEIRAGVALVVRLDPELL